MGMKVQIYTQKDACRALRAVKRQSVKTPFSRSICQITHRQRARLEMLPGDIPLAAGLGAPVRSRASVDPRPPGFHFQDSSWQHGNMASQATHTDWCLDVLIVSYNIYFKEWIQIMHIKGAHSHQYSLVLHSYVRFRAWRYAGFADSAMMLHQQLDALTRDTFRARDPEKGVIISGVR